MHFIWNSQHMGGVIVPLQSLASTVNEVNDIPYFLARPKFSDNTIRGVLTRVTVVFTMHVQSQSQVSCYFCFALFCFVCLESNLKGEEAGANGGGGWGG